MHAEIETLFPMAVTILSRLVEPEPVFFWAKKNPAPQIPVRMHFYFFHFFFSHPLFPSLFTCTRSLSRGELELEKNPALQTPDFKSRPLSQIYIIPSFLLLNPLNYEKNYRKVHILKIFVVYGYTLFF